MRYYLIMFQNVLLRHLSNVQLINYQTQKILGVRTILKNLFLLLKYQKLIPIGQLS